MCFLNLINRVVPDSSEQLWGGSEADGIQAARPFQLTPTFADESSVSSGSGISDGSEEWEAGAATALHSGVCGVHCRRRRRRGLIEDALRAGPGSAGVRGNSLRRCWVGLKPMCSGGC